MISLNKERASDRPGVYLTRYSANVALLPQEVYGSNAASLDYWSTKMFVDYGFDVYISTEMVSKVLRDFLSNKDEIPEEHSWMKHIYLHEGQPWTILPDYIKYVIIHQSHENYRFRGPREIPTQLYTYRLIRDCKCPIFYFQYDAALPLWLPAETRGMISTYAGCTIGEIANANIVVVSAGRQPEMTLQHGYNLSHDLVRVFTWDKDFHAVASPMLDKMALPVNNNPIKRIQFVGKNRNNGSRGNDLLHLADVLHKANSEYYVQLNGDWKKLVENDDFSVFNNIQYTGRIPGGIENVIKAYNESEFGILMGNDIYEAFNQYTIRVYEVIASGTVPLFEKSWYSTWKDIFDIDTQKFIEENLMFEKVEEIPELINKYHSNFADKREEVVNKIRNGLKSQLNQDYVNSEFKRMIEFADKGKDMSYEDQCNSTIDRFYKAESESKFKRIYEVADERRQRRVSECFGENPDYKDKANDINFLRSDFCFSTTPFTDDEVIELFGRK